MEKCFLVRILIRDEISHGIERHDIRSRSWPNGDERQQWRAKFEAERLIRAKLQHISPRLVIDVSWREVPFPVPVEPWIEREIRRGGAFL